MIKRDGHIHSPYCPHGSKDTLEEIIEKAIEIELEELSFTEHLCVPRYFVKKEFLDKCSPSKEEFYRYIKAVKEIRKNYKNIKINIGAEIDYVEGLEEEYKELLNEVGPLLEDSLLSVHFVKYKEEYYAIDYLDDFIRLLEVLELEKIYDLYYETLYKAITSDLGPYKPKRIGHPNLIRIFHKKFPLVYKNTLLLRKIVSTLKELDYEVDVNTAGLRKPYCGECYVSGTLDLLVKEYDVRRVYGSDAHQASDVGRDFSNEGK